MILSGIIFISGAVGIEMITGVFIENNIKSNQELIDSSSIFFLYTLEETLEMVGVSYFIYTLHSFFKKHTS